MSTKSDMSSRLHELCKRTWEKSVVSETRNSSYNGPRYVNQGPFCGLGLTSEGVGTKGFVYQKHGRYKGLAQDLLAMILDDVARIGAKALGISTSIDVDDMGYNCEFVYSVMEELAYILKDLEIPLLDGEYAEVGQSPTRSIFNGTAMWTVDPSRVIDGRAVRDGDHIIALQEKGFRSNGFTFLNGVLEQCWDKGKNPASGGINLEDELLRPSTIYYPTIRSLLSQKKITKEVISGMVHVTGGGIPGKLLKYLSPLNLSAYLSLTGLEVNPLISFFLQEGVVSSEESFNNWNMGCGYLIITQYPEIVIEELSQTSTPFFIVGIIENNKKNSEIEIDFNEETLTFK